MKAFCFCHWAAPTTFAPVDLTLFSHSKFCAHASDQPMPHAPCRHAPSPVASLPTGQPTRRHRHDPSAVEVRNLGSACSRPFGRPLQSTSSLSWPSAAAIPSSHRVFTEDCVTSLPARHRPAFPDTVAIVEARQMRRPRTHLGTCGVAASVSPAFTAPRLSPQARHTSP